MSSKNFLLAFLLFGPLTHAGATTPVPLSQQSSSKTLVDESTFINGPIYIVSNSSVETISYPNIEFVNGPIYIVNNSNLVSVNFPKLSYVNGPIYVTYNNHLDSVEYPKITFVNGPIYFYSNKK